MTDKDGQRATYNPPLLKLPDPNIMVKGRHGLFIANQHDSYIGRSLIVYGEYNEAESMLLNQLLRPGDAVMEIGANIGSHTVALCKAVGSQGLVIAVEPQPRIFRVLAATLELNAIANAEIHNIACGAEPGTLHLPVIEYDKVGNFGGVELSKEQGAQQIGCVCLDSLMPQHATVRLLKVDVEGMEAEVLRGATALLQRDRPIIYAENDRAAKKRELIDLIRGFGYKMWWHRPPLFNPHNHFGVTQNIFQTNDGHMLVSVNMLCIPKEIPVSMPAKGLQPVELD